MLAAAAVLAATLVLLSVPMVARAGRRAVERARRRLDERGDGRFVGFALVRRLGTGRALDRAFGLPGIALAGGAAMVAVGAVSPTAAARAVDLHVLALLFGMMALVAAFDLANGFEVAAAAVARRARTARALLVATAVGTAVLSALVLNDAVVLLLAPVLVRVCREMGLPAMPFLAVAAVSANVGSVATPVGNPQNALVAIAGGIGFVPWARVLAPVALVSLLLAVVWVLVFFRRELRAVVATPARVVPVWTNPRLAALALAGAGLALAGFVAAPRLGLGLDAVAFAAGGAVVLLAPLARASPLAVLRKVDLGVLVLFVGLFALVEGVETSGLLATLHARAGVDLGLPLGLAATVAVLSNLVSNVPAVVLLLPALETAPDLLLLAAASTLAGNATLVGSAANVIVAESARARGEAFDVARFVAFGLPLALATVLVAVGLVPRLA